MDPNQGCSLHCALMRLSTPDRTAPRFNHRLLCALSVGALWLLVCPTALAMDCNEDAAAGECVDATSFQWCEDGETKSAKCPEGQICVADHPWYDGPGCVATDETPCGEIPPEGECTTANGVVWCEEGEPKVFHCDEDTVCGWDDANSEYDCLPRANAGAPPEIPEGDAMSAASADAGESDDDPSLEEDIGPEEDSDAAAQPSDASGGFSSAQRGEGLSSEASERDPVSPTVTPTENPEGSTSESDSDDGGCSGGPLNGGWLFGMMVCLGWLTRRGARNAATA